MERQKDRQQDEEEIDQLISFEVGDEEFGLEILRVKEVIRTRQITWLPKAPHFVKGIINLRGDLIAIIDLRERFGLEHRADTATTRVIVVDVAGRLVGMVVDAASQVVRIPSGQIDPPPPVVGGLSAKYVKGIAKVGDQLVILLSLDHILTPEEQEELNRLEEAASQEQPDKQETVTVG